MDIGRVRRSFTVPTVAAARSADLFCPDQVGRAHRGAANLVATHGLGRL